MTFFDYVEKHQFLCFIYFILITEFIQSIVKTIANRGTRIGR